MRNDVVRCFLPCRKGSQRVPRKNIKPFAGYDNGLVQVKLKQLLSCRLVDEIVLSTNDEEILDYAAGLKQDRIRLHHRVNELSSSQTSTDQLVAHALELIPDGSILWTHVTSPFITGRIYDRLIMEYIDRLSQGYDSLMTVSEIYNFLWQEGKPINYDRLVEKWPRTQDLEPVYEVNSGAFIAPCDVYRRNNDRIGALPYLYVLDKLTAHDVDWPEDFSIAECMVEKELVLI